VPLVGKILSLYPYLSSQIPDEYQVTISELSSPLSYDLLKPQENSVEWNTGILQFFLFEVNTGIVSEGRFHGQGLRSTCVIFSAPWMLLLTSLHFCLHLIFAVAPRPGAEILLFLVSRQNINYKYINKSS
jgi:hypothetical protein